MPAYLESQKMNAYELEQAAFDSACDYAKETIEYIQGYADGAFNLTVSDAVAQKILVCRAECKAEIEKNNEGQNNRWHFVQKPLEEIEL